MKILEEWLIRDSCSIKNRIFFSSVGLDLANSDGTFSEGLSSFYRNMIDGGIGMVIIGNSTVSENSKLHNTGLALYNEKHSETLKPIIRYAEQEGVLLVVQLQHYGSQGSTKYTDSPLLSPSGQPAKKNNFNTFSDSTVEMSHADIQNVIGDFVNAAKLVKEAGGRAIQIQAGNGYLISSFISPYTNHREDEYGGNDERRAKFLLDIIKEIKKHCGEDLLVFIRLGIDDCFDEYIGLKPESVEYLVRELDKLDIAGIECTMCIGETFNRFLRGYDISIKKRLFDGAKMIKSFVSSVPVGCTGLVKSIDDAEHLIGEYGLDYIGMARALFADPMLLSKYRKNVPANVCRFDGYCFRDKSNPALDRVYCCVNPDYIRSPEIKYES